MPYLKDLSKSPLLPSLQALRILILTQEKKPFLFYQKSSVFQTMLL